MGFNRSYFKVYRYYIVSYTQLQRSKGGKEYETKSIRKKLDHNVLHVHTIYVLPRQGRREHPLVNTSLIESTSSPMKAWIKCHITKSCWRKLGKKTHLSTQRPKGWWGWNCWAAVEFGRCASPSNWRVSSRTASPPPSFLSSSSRTHWSRTACPTRDRRSRIQASRSRSCWQPRLQKIR